MIHNLGKPTHNPRRAPWNCLATGDGRLGDEAVRNPATGLLTTLHRVPSHRVSIRYPLVMESPQGRKSGLPPVVDENTEILIMGTLPGDKTLASGQYYADRRNYFWKLVGAVLNQNLVGSTYQDKISCLKANHIGIWDAYHSAFRPGSMDTDITEAELNDFTGLKELAPNLRLVGFNGKAAAGAKDSLVHLGYETCLLPSSSGGYRGDQEGRLACWKAALVHRTGVAHKP